MAEVDTSSYPRPQPPQNPLDQITKIGQTMDTLGNVEVGKAVQGAIGPDGQIDRNAIASALKQTVAGSAKAIPTLDSFEKLRQAGHVSDMAGLDNFQKRMALVNHLFGQLAAKDNPSIDDVNSIAARVLDPGLAAHKYGLTFPVVMNAVKTFRGPDGRPLSPQEIKKKALDMQLMTAETGEQLSALSPRHQVIDDGNTIRFTPTGSAINPRNPQITKRIPTGTEVTNPDTRQKELVPPQPAAPEDYEVDSFGRMIQPLDRHGQPLSNVVRQPQAPAPAPTRQQMGQTEPTPENGLPGTFAERFKPNMRGAPVAGLRPGVAEAATDTAKTSAGLGNQLTTAANEVPAVRGLLDNLDKTVGDFTPGPGADWRRVAKAFTNTVVPDSWQTEGGILDPKSIASQESFNKFAQQLAQRQFQQLGGTGTDAKLNSAIHTSPNELLSKMGNKEIIGMLRGNNDALAVQSREWNKWKKVNGEDSYSDFIDSFNQHYNPRVFQFQYIPKDKRQEWYKSMSPDQRRAFEESADYAIRNKWIKP